MQINTTEGQVLNLPQCLSAILSNNTKFSQNYILVSHSNEKVYLNYDLFDHSKIIIDKKTIITTHPHLQCKYHSK